MHIRGYVKIALYQGLVSTVIGMASVYVLGTLILHAARRVYLDLN